MTKFNVFFSLIYYVIIAEYAATSAINISNKLPVNVNSTNISNNRSNSIAKDEILFVNKNYQNWKSIENSPKRNLLPEIIPNKTCIKRQHFNSGTQQLIITKSIKAVNPANDNPIKRMDGTSNNKRIRETGTHAWNPAWNLAWTPTTTYNSKALNNEISPSRVKRRAINRSQLKLNTTIGGTRRQDRLSAAPGSNLTVEFKECGFVFCFAENFHLNDSIHRWDYHVEWTIPRLVKENVHSDRIFVLGDHFQMAHAYLVFRRFDKSYEGEYTCSLTLLGKTVVDIQVNLVFSSSLSTKQCIVGNE